MPPKRPNVEHDVIEPGPDPFEADGVWLKTALHTHTDRTDGDLPPDRHVQHHEWMGFDVVVLTDHWTLTTHPSNDRILVIQGAELAVDPLAKGRYTEILAIGIDDIPDDPGGDRAYWEQVDNYLFKTFPDLSTAAANITAQGGVAFVAHPYWSGLPLEVVLEAEGIAGFEVYNASAERETGRGDSSYIWDLALDRGRLLFGIATDDSHYPGFDIGDAWTMIRASERTQEAVLQALATGSFYATSGPEILDVRRDRDGIEVRCSPAASVVLRSGFERGLSVEAGPRARLERARILERDGSGAIVRARFHPEPDDLTYARIQVNDERGRSAWTNPI